LILPPSPGQRPMIFNHFSQSILLMEILRPAGQVIHRFRRTRKRSGFVLISLKKNL
jgi:hypothetical protein